jgi:hypothetical protein
MSDTPRTDERAVTHPWVNGEAKYVAVEFACELERENAMLRADLLIEEERSIYWRDNEGKAMAENAALRGALSIAENGLRHALMMEPSDPFKRGKIITTALDAVRVAIRLSSDAEKSQEGK